MVWHIWIGVIHDEEQVVVLVVQKGAVAGVNITLGLPIIRVSVDHGTAFGHAGSGTQNELSLVNSIDNAILMAESRLKRQGK